MKEKNNNHDFYKGVIIGFAIFTLVILAFFLGVKVGRREYYYRYPPIFHPWMKEPRKGFIPPKFRGRGTVGVVDSVGKDSFVVKNRWGELVTVVVDKNTKYYVDGKQGSFSDIKKGKNVFVVGQPNEKEITIQAEAIRIY